MRSIPFRSVLLLYAVLAAHAGAVAAPAARAAVRHDVVARTFEFDPRDLVVAPGDTVQWIWESGTHTVTEGENCVVDDPLFNAELIPATPTFRWVFEQPGRTEYFCIPHCVIQDMRGTVTVRASVPDRVYRADADGSQMVPPVESDATAVLRAYLSSGRDRLHVQVAVRDLVHPMTGCHLHLGPPGSNGPMILDIGTFEDSIAVDLPLAPSYVAPLAAGNVYLAVHTEPYPVGEIRGQVLSQAAFTLEAALDPGEETNPVQSNGIGYAEIYAWPDSSRMHLELDVSGLTSAVIGSHVHEAPPGEDGPIRFDVGVFEGRVVRDFPVTPAQVAVLLAGGYYLNVHTEQYLFGEIRGQIGEQSVSSIDEVGGPSDPPLGPDGPVPRGEPDRLELGVRPTVTGGELAVSFRLEEAAPISIEAWSVEGRRLGATRLPGATGWNVLSLDLRRDLGLSGPAGRIFLRVRAGERSGRAIVVLRP